MTCLPCPRDGGHIEADRSSLMSRFILTNWGISRLCDINSNYLRTECVDTETNMRNFSGSQAWAPCRITVRGAAPAGSSSNVASRAAYGGRVGGTMVLAGVRAVPQGRESGPTEGVISCGHFTVRGAAVGDHPCSADPRGEHQGGPSHRRRPLRLLPRLDRYGAVHQPVPE